MIRGDADLLLNVALRLATNHSRAMPRILLVEDFEAQRRAVSSALELCGFVVDTAATLAEGRKRYAQQLYDLVLLDRGLGHEDGLLLRDECRVASDRTPFIIVSGRPDDRSFGDDDDIDIYLRKPVPAERLLVNIRTALRQVSTRPFQLAGLIFDHIRSELRFSDGSARRLGALQARLLFLLATRPHFPVPKDRIVSDLWRENDPEDNCVEDLVKGLRQALGPWRPLIQTRRKRGYELVLRTAETA